MASKKSTAVIQPNLGIYYDREPIAMNPRMLQDGLNFRVKEGVLSNLNLGWQRFGSWTLNGPVVYGGSFVLNDGTEKLVFATYTDIYLYGSDTVVTYLTPRYQTGTVSRSTTAVTGSGTAFLANVKSGDQIHFGAIDINSTTATWDTVVSVIDNTHLTTLGSGTVSSGAYTIRNLFSGGLSDIWQSEIFVNASPSGVNELWLTNGVDSIVRWNGSDTQVEKMSPQIGFTAKTMRVYDNMMLFANVNQSGTNKPTDLLNSDVGQPQNVGSLSSGLSAQFKAHSGIEPILRIEPLGQNIVIYSQFNRITLAQFVGTPLLFIFQQISATVGILAANALANFGNYHEFLAPSTQYYFDGATIKPVNNHVWREILRTQDSGRIQITFGYTDQQNADIIWSLPSTSDPDVNLGASIAYNEHYLEDPGTNLPTPFSKRSFPFRSLTGFKRADGLTWDQITSEWQNTNFRWNDRFFAGSFPLILAGDDTGNVYSINTTQDADGVALPSFVTFSRKATVDGRMRGMLTRVYPFLTPLTNPINVTVFMSDSTEGAAMITDTQSFDQIQPEGGHFTVHYRRGRYYEVKFSTEGPNQPWEVGGYDTDIRPGGKR